jgi:Na+-transporting methylmalonyl-CoA/oxaloacetate decarboxylase gamma subunit
MQGGKVTVLTALWIVLLGMAIIFIVLGVLLGIMLLLNRLLKPEANEKH